MKNTKGFETLVKFLVANGISFEYFGPGYEDDTPYIRIYGCHYNRLRRSKAKWCFPGDTHFIDIFGDVDTDNKYDVTIYKEPYEYERRLNLSNNYHEIRRLITIQTLIKFCKEDFGIEGA